MKLNKSVICLLICVLVLVQVECRTSLAKKTKQKSKVFSQVWGDWNQADIEVTGKGVYTFRGKLRDVVYENKPYGIQFDALEQTSQNDVTGFIPHGQAFVAFTEQDLPRSMIDYRQIKNCVFTTNDNAGFFKMFDHWTITFDLSFTEDYNVKLADQQHYGDSVKVIFTLPNAGKSKVTTYKAGLKKNCEARNNHVNDLKEAAVTAGNNYYSLWYDYQNRQQTLVQQAKQVKDAKVLVEKVRTQQVKKQEELSKNIKTQQDALTDVQKQLLEVSSQKSQTEEETETLTTKLTSIEITLQNVQTTQTLVRKTIQTSQLELADAVAAQTGAVEAKDKLAVEQKQTEENKQKTQADYDKLIKEIEKKQKDAQNDYKKKMKANEEASKKIMENIVNTDNSISTNAQTIQGLKVTIELYEVQIISIIKQIKSIKVSISELVVTINKKRNMAQQFNEQIQRFQKDVKARQQRAQEIADANKQTLAELKQKELSQISLLTNLTKAEKDKQIYYATTAATAIEKANGDFTKALAAIVHTAGKTSHRTERAATKVLANQHVSELAMVVSSTDTLIKKAFMRQAKQQKQLNRLAKLRQRQIKVIRMQRVKVQHNLKHRLRRNK